jgi:hypothetical protein
MSSSLKLTLLLSKSFSLFLRCVQYPVILVRPSCVLVSLFELRAIITAREVLVFDPETREAWAARPRIPPLARLLTQRLQAGREEPAEGSAGVNGAETAGVNGADKQPLGPGTGPDRGGGRSCRKCGLLREGSSKVYAPLQALRMAQLLDRERLWKLKGEERGLQLVLDSLHGSPDKAGVGKDSEPMGKLESRIAGVVAEREALSRRLSKRRAEIHRAKMKVLSDRIGSALADRQAFRPAQERNAEQVSSQDLVSMFSETNRIRDKLGLTPLKLLPEEMTGDDKKGRADLAGECDHTWAGLESWDSGSVGVPRSPVTATSPAALIQRGAPEAALPFELRVLEVILDDTCRTLVEKYEVRSGAVLCAAVSARACTIGFGCPKKTLFLCPFHMISDSFVTMRLMKVSQSTFEFFNRKEYVSLRRKLSAWSFEVSRPSFSWRTDNACGTCPPLRGLQDSGNQSQHSAS